MMYAMPNQFLARSTVVIVFAALSTACSSNPPSAASPSTVASATTTNRATTTTPAATSNAATTTTAAGGTAAVTATETLDLTKLPLGNEKESTTGAQSGLIYVCRSRINANAPGASKNGPWIDAAAGTWDSTTKATVDGEVDWPTANVSITLSGDTRIISGNGLPQHTTGVYPISKTDDAYQYDRNPNSVAAQTISVSLPANPVVAATPGCIGGGSIGIAVNGVAIFDGFDAGGRDAVATEIQDTCHGHPEREGTYHYHDLSSCLDDAGTGHSNLIGYAKDGFGIYGYRGEDGVELTNADLDACHGHTHTIVWDGVEVSMYHYHATREFPYTVSCMRGTPVR